MKRVVFIHVLLLKPPFPSDILFKPQMRMQLKPCSCKSEEFRTASEQNICFLPLDSRSRERTQGLLKLDEFVDLLWPCKHNHRISPWYIPYVCICMNPKEKAHPSFYVPAGPTFASLGPQISDAPCSAAVPWRSWRSWRSWTLLITSKRTEPKRIWVNFR